MRRENLIAPMLHGRGEGDSTNPIRVVSAWRALALLIVSAVAVGLLIAWGGDA
jgi:hypothetical protein